MYLFASCFSVPETADLNFDWQIFSTMLSIPGCWSNCRGTAAPPLVVRLRCTVFHLVQLKAKAARTAKATVQKKVAICQNQINSKSKKHVSCFVSCVIEFVFSIFCKLLLHLFIEAAGVFRKNKSWRTENLIKPVVFFFRTDPSTGMWGKGS